MGKDFSKLREGGEDSKTGKKIDFLVSQTSKFIVYLDSEHYIWWDVSVDEEYDNVPGWGEVLNRVTVLQATPTPGLDDKELESFRVLVATAVERLLDDKNAKAANQVLDKAQSYIETRNADFARQPYLIGSTLAATLSLLWALLLYWGRDAVEIQAVLGGRTGHEVTMASLI